MPMLTGLKPVLTTMALALALSLAACASLASVPAEKETTEQTDSKLVRFANVLVSLRPPEQVQLESAARVGSEFLTNGLADYNEVRVLHYKWKALRIDNEESVSSAVELYASRECEGGLWVEGVDAPACLVDVRIALNVPLLPLRELDRGSAHLEYVLF